MLPKQKLKRLYKSGLSMQEISDKAGWSYHQVTYWMDKYNILRRSRSAANYIKYNPKGDPFKIRNKFNKKEAELKCIGLGIYWGEGNRSSKTAVRLGNSDPQLIKVFREFLIKICGVKEERIKYNLLLFNDADRRKAIKFWNMELGYSLNRIGSVTSLKPRGKGTYKRKSMTGVMFIEFNNTKLKKEIDKMMEVLYSLPG